jgi:hypothetical protein
MGIRRKSSGFLDAYSAPVTLMSRPVGRQPFKSICSFEIYEESAIS